MEPMKPKYLTRPKQITQGKDPFDSLSFIGRSQDLSYLTADACEKLKHPVTIIDFETLERIDSESQYYALRPTCRLLRHCADDKECYKCDFQFASLFKGLTRPNIYSTLKSKENQFADSELTVKQCEDTVFIEYRCVMLGYREMVFPIFYHDNVIGVLFVGQTLINSSQDLKKARSMRRKFLEDNADRLFGHFVEDYNRKNDEKTTTMDIFDQIMAENDSFNQILLHDCYGIPNGIASMTITEIEYRKLIENACSQAKTIKEELRKAMGKKRKKYFDDKLTSLISEWHKEKNDVQTIWKAFMKIMQTIKDAFELKGVYVFGDGKVSSATTGKVKKQLRSDGTIFTPPKINGIVQRDSTPYFDYTKLGESGELDRFEATTSFRSPTLLDGLCGDIFADNIVLIAFPNLVIAFEVESRDAESETYEVLFDSIAEKLTGMNSRLELLTIGFLKEHHELTLRMYRHETAHIAERLSSRNRRYLESDEKVKLLTGSKREAVYQDIKSSISLVSNMGLTIGVVLDRLNDEEKELTEEKPINVFKDLLYKWEAMFSDKLEVRNLQIVVPAVSRIDQWRPDQIKINNYLFELLVYNLVDNAVKYAYRGTSIYLDCKKEYSTRASVYILKVTSLGPEMETGDIPYGLYYRGSSEDQDSDVHSGGVAGGDGLGLFVVKRICDLLGLQVTHSCRRIARYNVPLIKWYFDMVPLEQQDSKLKEALKRYSHSYEDDRDFSPEWFAPENEITEDDLSVEYLLRRIRSGVYLTTFEVQIPVTLEYN